MNNQEARDLALNLLQADSEHEVITILTAAGLWDDEDAWRLYGDRDGNYATIGNQQSRPEAALVEKVINAVDARLMNECLVRGIDPKGPDSPQSIRHAVSRFIDGKDEPLGEVGGTVQSWTPAKQLEQSRHITLAVTGNKPRAGNPCITIADSGEGQTPSSVPETFVSLDKDNKLRIQFVQGKFNMGGTGALKHCGENGIQLIITRRNPAIVAAIGDTSSDADLWSVTVIRRQEPTAGAGHVRNSVFRYLAPVGASENPERGNVLTFSADSIPAMPEGNSAYSREMAWGSVVKLYEYEIRGRSHALMGDGLLFGLEILLPQIALPVRVHECRDYRGHEGSFANSLVGLVARLDENRGDNLEEGYPDSSSFSVRGESMVARIYAFKPEKANTYRTNEGIIFTINGQTHGHIPKSFFARKKVKMQRLGDSLLIVIDCSELSVRAREDLFMNSRDRLSNGALRRAIESQLEDAIGNHPGLRALQERRRQGEVADRLKESRPLEDVLSAVLKSSPSLVRLFLLGQRLTAPHRSGGNGGGTGGPDGEGGEFRGRKHPTFFRFHKKNDGESLDRHCELGRKCRMKFETDVENGYFARTDVKGRYQVEVVDGALEGSEIHHNLTLYNGIANWSVTLPDDKIEVGDSVTLVCTIDDDTLVEPFVNTVRLTVQPRSTPKGGGGSRTSRTGSGGSGSGGTGSDGSGSGTSNQDPGGIEMPDVVRVHKDDVAWKGQGFDEKTACKVVEDRAPDDPDKSVYTFYINVDNLYLKTDMKGAKSDVALIEAKFVYGNVLLGLALLNDGPNGTGPSEEADDEAPLVTTAVEKTTRAMAPFLVPMIDYLGALSPEEVTQLAEAGDDD